jgi:DNA-damage-inducible protein J
MSRPSEVIRKLALELPPDQRLALAMELSEGIQLHPGLDQPESGYDAWFRAGVELALTETGPGVPHQEAVEDIAAVLRAAREAQKLKASA